MRILFLSDIHGSSENLLKILDYVKSFPVEQIVLLGDLLYHGPRNPVLDDYAPPSVVEILNPLQNKLIAVRGNCDCEVDQMVLQFPMLSEYSVLLLDGRKFFLSHGHHWNPENPPPLGTCDVLCNGHTHIPKLVKLPSGLVAFNPGSISLPKGGSRASFGLYDDQVLSIREAANPENIIASLDLTRE